MQKERERERVRKMPFSISRNINHAIFCCEQKKNALFQKFSLIFFQRIGIN